MTDLLVGLDLDNTIVDYGSVIAAVARERALLPASFAGSKREVRDALRLLPGGEHEWTRLQAEIYGPRIDGAQAFPGVLAFLDYCSEHAITVVIVSHKTEYAGLGGTCNLRDAARSWLRTNGILGARVDETHLHFTSTRGEKLTRIRDLRPALFVDDLSEIFLEDAFPSDVEPWLFAPDGEVPPSESLGGIRHERTHRGHQSSS